MKEEYLLVGLLEDFESTLLILEKLAPDLFKGIVADYRKPTSTKGRGKSVAQNEYILRSRDLRLGFQSNINNLNKMVVRLLANRGKER